MNTKRHQAFGGAAGREGPTGSVERGLGPAGNLLTRTAATSPRLEAVILAGGEGTRCSALAKALSWQRGSKVVCNAGRRTSAAADNGREGRGALHSWPWGLGGRTGTSGTSGPPARPANRRLRKRNPRRPAAHPVPTLGHRGRSRRQCLTL